MRRAARDVFAGIQASQEKGEQVMVSVSALMSAITAPAESHLTGAFVQHVCSSQRACHVQARPNSLWWQGVLYHTKSFLTLSSLMGMCHVCPLIRWNFFVFFLCGVPERSGGYLVHEAKSIRHAYMHECVIAFVDLGLHFVYACVCMCMYITIVASDVLSCV